MKILYFIKNKIFLKEENVIWAALAILYFIIFIYTGYYTFLVNNQFATHRDNYYVIQKFALEHTDPGDLTTRFNQSGEEVTLGYEKENYVKDLMRREASSFTAVNEVAAQSFHIVLGSLLGFLSASLITTQKIKKKKNESSSKSGEKSVGSTSAKSTTYKEEEDRQKFGWKWWTVLMVYCFILVFTGLITFDFNNSYATQFPVDLVSEFEIRTSGANVENKITNIEKIYSIKTFEQLDFFQELLEYELMSVEDINSIASQSFNISLGALLGFFASTGTRLSRKN